MPATAGANATAQRYPPTAPTASTQQQRRPPQPTSHAQSRRRQAAAYPAGAVIVTFQVGSEQYRILLTDPANIDNARRLLAGEEVPPIPNGLVVRGDPGVNAPWSWHIDPDSLEFADVTTEVCDGLPSYVEDGSLTGDRFCPWSAEVVSVEEVVSIEPAG